MILDLNSDFLNELRSLRKSVPYHNTCISRKFRETSTEMDVKNCQCYCKKKKHIWTIMFHGLYTLVDHRNDGKMFKTLQ